MEGAAAGLGTREERMNSSDLTRNSFTVRRKSGECISYGIKDARDVGL